MFRILRDALFATLGFILVYFLLLGFFKFVPLPHFNPLHNPIEDFELSDIYFSAVQRPDTLETEIVIVNASDKSRLEKARMIEKIAQQEPLAIGVDLLFTKGIYSSEDSVLARTLIRWKPKVVLATRLIDDELEASSGSFYKSMIGLDTTRGDFNFGYFNFEGDHKTSTVRKVKLLEKYDNLQFESFGLKIFEIAYPDRRVDIAAYQERDVAEIINYKLPYAGPSRFLVLDSVPNDPSSIKGKIVLFGQRDKRLTEDFLFTPQNKLLSRSFPDMKGVEIHAHILAMLRTGEFIKEASYMWLVKLTYIYLTMIFLLFLLEKLKHLYHLGIELLLFSSTLLGIYLCCFLLQQYRFKLDPTPYIALLFSEGIFLCVYETIIIWLRKKNKLPFKSYLSH